MKRRYVTMRTKAADMYDEPDAENYLARTIYQPEPQLDTCGGNHDQVQAR